MKLIIDIPDKYISIDTNVKEWIDKAGDDCKVRPLPKGHGRLIDADRLELDYDWNEYETDTGQLIVNGYQAYSSTQIESAPTIIEADTEPMYYPQVDGITPTVVAESEDKE